MNKRNLLVVLLAVVLVVSCSKTEKQEQKAPQQSAKKVEKVAPAIKPGEKGSKAADFTVVDLEGNEVSLSDYKGKTILLNFWATWCPPCRAEIPDFIKMYDKYKDRGLVILGVGGFREGADKIKPFAEENGMNYPLLVLREDQQKPVTDSFGGVPGIPTSFLIDPDGIIRDKHVGPLTEEQFLEVAGEYLK